MDILGVIKNLFGAVMEGLGFARQRAAEKNAPEIKANADAAVDQAIKDTARKAIADANLDEIRKMGSE